MNIYQSRILPYVAAGATLATPLAVFAQGDVDQVFARIYNILGNVVPILLGIAVIWFIWALVKYIGSQGDEDGKKEARSQMLNGIIIIAVMLGVWGLAAILLNTFGITQEGPSIVPGIPGNNNGLPGLGGGNWW